MREDYLGLLYDSIDEHYGSVENYLHQGLGLTQEDLTNLRNRYLE